MSKSKLISTRRTTVLSLPLQKRFPGKANRLERLVKDIDKLRPQKFS